MTHNPTRSWPGLLALVALPLALLAGCGDDNPQPPAPTATATSAPTLTPTAAPTHTATLASTATVTATPVPSTPTPTVPNASAGAACVKLAGCGQCLINATGQCISNDECAPRLSADAAVCVNGISGCDATALGDCLFLGCDGNDATGSCQ